VREKERKRDERREMKGKGKCRGIKDREGKGIRTENEGAG
jgi:hypothetical protein